MGNLGLIRVLTCRLFAGCDADLPTHTPPPSQDLEAQLAKKRNELTEAQDKLKTVGKEGYMRLAAEVETYKVSSFLVFSPLRFACLASHPTRTASTGQRHPEDTQSLTQLTR